MNRRKIKIFVASSILVSSLILLVFVGVKNTSLRHFRPEQLMAKAQEAVSYTHLTLPTNREV